MFTGEQIDAAISGINATAEYIDSVVTIKAPESSVKLTFISPSDFKSTDTYTLNGRKIELFDLNNNPIEDGWKKGVPIELTLNGDKAFFKAGGSGKNDTLPPLLGNMTVEVVEGDENDTYTIKMDKLVLDKTTEMVGGAQLEWGEEMPAKPGKGTGGIKTWTREEVITTGKPYDGLYLGDVVPSDAVTETLIYLPENDSGKVKLVPFIVLSVNYLDGVYVVRKMLKETWAGAYATRYEYGDGEADQWFTGTYLNSVLHKSVSEKVMTCEIKTTTGTLSRKCWAMSLAELGSTVTTDGTAMPYFNADAKRIGKTDDTNRALNYWTRTPEPNNYGNAYLVNTSGGLQYTRTDSTGLNYRPSFVLPKDFKIQQRPDGSYTVWNEQGLMTLGDLEASTDVIETTVNAAEMYKSPTGPKTIITELSYDKKNYNKTDGGLLVRKELIKDSIIFSSGPGNYLSSYAMIGADEWATAEIGSVTRTDFVLFDSFKKILMSTPIKYRENGTVTKEVTKKGFILSIDEVGNNHIWGDSATGEEIERYWNQPQNRISYYGNTKKGYWLRDGASADKNVYTISASGVPVIAVSSNSYGIKVACVVPLTTPIRALADGTYDLVPEDPALSAQSISTMAEAGTPVQLKDIPVSTTGNAVMLKIPETDGENHNYIYLRKGNEPTPTEEAYVSHTVEVPHGQKVVFRQFTQNQKKQFQTMLVGGVYPPLTDEGPTYSEVLSENTWTQIAQAVADGDPILDVWQVGDTKDEVINGETLTFAIMGKNMDDLADGSGKAPLTFGMKNLMAETRQMNATNTNGSSFAGSVMYSWLSGTIYPNLPTELKDAIKAVNKKTASGGGSSSASSIRTDAMYLWLFSEIEVFGTTTYSYAGEGQQYPYFATADNRIKRLSNGAGNASYWWERSPNQNSSLTFCRVGTSGSANNGGAGGSYGVCFGFCI